MIFQSLKNIKIKNESKYFYLLGDKAYKIKDSFKLNNKTVKIIIINIDCLVILLFIYNNLI